MNKVTMKIDGMACGMCEAHVNDVIRKVVPQAKKVASSHAKGESSFLTDADFSEEELRSAITETGYTVLSLTSQPYEKKGLFGRK